MKEKYQKWNIKYFATSDYDKYTNNILMETLKKSEWIWVGWKDENISNKKINKYITNKGRIKSRAR